MTKIISFFAKNPRKLFLMDSLGAFLTTVMLFMVLPNMKTYFGMPRITLENLALIAFCFALYSISCFLFLKKNWSFYLRIIAYANISYCCLTLFLLIVLHAQITKFDWMYFFGEIAIVLSLVALELKVVKSL
jgi:hypothetical protein